MKKYVWIIVVVAAVGGGLYAASRFKANVDRGEDGQIERITLEPKEGTLPSFLAAPAETDSAAPAAAARGTIRIGSFHLDELDEHRLARPVVSDLLVKLVPADLGPAPERAEVPQPVGTSPAAAACFAQR